MFQGRILKGHGINKIVIRGTQELIEIMVKLSVVKY